MTEIDVPDWVVEAGAKAILAIANPKCVGELAAYQFAEDALAAALGAWVVPVGCIESHELSEMAANRKSSYDLWNLRTYEPDDTILYVLRQERQE